MGQYIDDLKRKLKILRIFFIGGAAIGLVIAVMSGSEEGIAHFFASLTMGVALPSMWVCLKTIHMKCISIVEIFTSRDTAFGIVIFFGYLAGGGIPLLSMISAPFVSIYKYITISKEIKEYECS